MGRFGEGGPVGRLGAGARATQDGDGTCIPEGGMEKVRGDVTLYKCETIWDSNCYYFWSGSLLDWIQINGIGEKKTCRKSSRQAIALGLLLFLFF